MLKNKINIKSNMSINTNGQFKLYSWNVLHIVHELNYAFDCSFVLDLWLNNENERLNQLAKIIVKRASYENAVVCLQECSGELLKMLYEMNTHNDYSIHKYKYGRNPHLKNYLATNPYPSNNCTEYLVTLVGKNISVNNTSVVQFTNTGKASLMLNINIGEKHVLIANIHCPFGSSRNIAFEQLLEEINMHNFVIIGDLNSEMWELKKIFCDDNLYNFSNIKRPTRIAKFIKKTKKGDEIILRESTLDHMIGSKNITFCKIVVEPNNSLSDHLLIGSTVTLA